MWQEKLKVQLREFQQYGKKLVVAWDTGGDDQIITFSFTDKTEPNLDNEVYSNLISYLIEEFELPKNGENYNEGTGTFSIEDDGRVLFEFDEYAYADLSESDHYVEEFSIPATETMKILLTDCKTSKLDFYGSVSLLKEVSQYIQLSTDADIIKLKEERMIKLREEIKEIVLAKCKPPYDGSQITYSGTIDQENIYFNSLSQVTYTIFEDNENKKMYLFE
jgi:hypothetical protein